MNSTVPTEKLFTAAEVAEISGVDATALRALEPDYFGSPGHWRMVGNSPVYTAKGVRILADELAKLGNEEAAAKLRGAATVAETPSRALIEPKTKTQPYYKEGQYA